MSAPASARAAAMPRPMPRPAPVTTATCPVRANILLPSAIASSPTPISGPADAGSKRSAAVLARVPARAPPIPADLRPRPLRAARRTAPGRRRTGQGVSPRSRTLRRSLVAPVLVLLLSSGAWASPPRARIEFWTISLQPFFTGYVQGLIAAYERAHPDVQIRWIDVPPQTIEQKLLAAIAGGVGPEVVNLNTEGTLRMAEARALVDMDGAVPPAARGRYFPNIWSSTRSGGAAYGIPWYVVPNVLAYNRALFRRAGLDPARPPASEEAFVQAATAIKARTGVYGFMPNIDGIRFLRVFQEEGLSILAPDRRRAVFNSAAHVRVLARYVALFKQDLFPADTLQRRYLAATARYAAGQLAMLTTGPQFLLRVRADSPDVYRETAVAPYPLGPGRVLDLPTTQLDVPLASRQRRAGPASGRIAGRAAVRLPRRPAADPDRVSVPPSRPRAAGDVHLLPGDLRHRAEPVRVQHHQPAALRGPGEFPPAGRRPVLLDRPRQQRQIPRGRPRAPGMRDSPRALGAPLGARHRLAARRLLPAGRHLDRRRGDPLAVAVR